MMRWCIGTLLSEDGTELEDFMVFECNLVISKFWLWYCLRSVLLKFRIGGVSWVEKWRSGEGVRPFNNAHFGWALTEAALKMHSFLSSAWLSFELFDMGVHPSTRKRKAAVEQAIHFQPNGEKKAHFQC